MPVIALIIVAFLLVQHSQAQQPRAAGQQAFSPLGSLGGSVLVPSQSTAPGPANVIGNQAEGLALNSGVGIGAAGAQAAITGIGTVAGALSTAALTAGIGAAVFFGAEAVSDIFKCGTIGQRGCQKRSDASDQIAGIEAMKRAMYAVETGQASASAAAAQISSIANQIYRAYENKASGNSFTMDVQGSDAGIPNNSLSGQFMLRQKTSLKGMTQSFIAYLPTLAAAAAGSPVASQQPIQLLPAALGGGVDGAPPLYDSLQVMVA